MNVRWKVLGVLVFGLMNYNCHAMQTENTIKLSDGRILGYAEYGDSLGYPIFYFHGGQESRLSSKFMDSTAKKLNIRIISPDRPGVGISTYQENRQFLDWGNDITELADFLGLNKYSVFGLSGGAPHVLACLISDSSRIVNASIVAGATPYNYKGTLKGMWFPVKLIHWFASWKNDKQLRKFMQNDFDGLVNKPEKRIKQFQNYLPAPDKKLMTEHPEYGWEFIEGSKESYRQGIDAVVQEWKLYVSDWQMELNTIHSPLNLWYGSSDKMAPTYRGHYYKKELPKSKLKVFENEGHFSLIRNHLEEILTELKSTHNNV
ncbi:MAG: alpha/beta hydrolase [Flavobacteriales bacterium]|nr:alpha/beta hydrolase [Flavobacteriales bacterium]